MKLVYRYRIVTKVYLQVKNDIGAINKYVKKIVSQLLVSKMYIL